MKNFRKERAAELLRGFLGTELLRLLDDRLTRVTISEIEMTPDLKIAKIYWTTFVAQSAGNGAGGEGESAPPPVLSENDPAVVAAREALLAVRNELRRRVGAALEFRHVPELHFHFDGSASRGARIDFLLQKAGQRTGTRSA